MTTTTPATITPAPRGISPVLVGLLRGLVYAVLLAAGAAVVAFTDGLDAESLGSHAWALPVIAALGRTIEGWIDKQRGQAPQKVGGSAPAEPLAYTADVALTPPPLPEPGLVTGGPAPEAVLTGRLTGAIRVAMPRAADTTVDRLAGELASFLTHNPDATHLDVARYLKDVGMPRAQRPVRDKVAAAVRRALDL